MAGVPLPKFSREDEAREERRKTLHDVVELAAKFFEATLAARRRQGARLSRRPRPRSGDAAQVPPRLCAAERFALKEHLGKEGISSEDMVEAGLAGRGRRHPGALRPLPRPRDVSDHRPARPRDRLRRPRAREGCAGEVPQLAGDAALPQGRDALQHRRRARRPRTRARAVDRGRRLCRRHRHGDRRLRGDGGAARHRAHRRAAGAALEDDGRADPLLRRRRRRPARGLSGGRSGAAAAQARQEPEFASLPEGRIPTISCAPAAARRSTRCSAPRARSPRCCGCARPRPAPSIRRSGAPRSRRAWARSPPRSATIPCANYRRDFGDRLRRLFDGDRAGRCRGRRAVGWRTAAVANANRREAGNPRRLARARPRFARFRGEPYVVASPQLASSPVHRGHRAAIPRREALILQACHQPPVAAARPSGGARRLEFRTPRRPGEGRADRHRSPMAGRRTALRWPRGGAAGWRRGRWAHREGHHHALGLGAARRRPRPRTS